MLRPIQHVNQLFQRRAGGRVVPHPEGPKPCVRDVPPGWVQFLAVTHRNEVVVELIGIALHAGQVVVDELPQLQRGVPLPLAAVEHQWHDVRQFGALDLAGALEHVVEQAHVHVHAHRHEMIDVGLDFQHDHHVEWLAVALADLPDHVVEAGHALITGVVGLQLLDGGEVDMLEPGLLDKAP